MTKTKIALLITALITAGYAISFIGSEGALMERFPDIDPDDVKAAHRKMYRAALKGQYNDLDMDDDAVMDSVFLAVVNNL